MKKDWNIVIGRTELFEVVEAYTYDEALKLAKQKYPKEHNVGVILSAF